MASQHPQRLIDELNQQVMHLYGQRKYREALDPARQLCLLARRVLGNNHPYTAASLNNLGALFRAMGDLAAARSCFEQALEIHLRLVGNDHPDTATSLDNLGVLLENMGDLAAARPYHEQALEIRRRVLGNDHPDTAASLNNLGYLLQAMGDLARARLYYEQALRIRRRVLGNDHPDTAQSLNNLGYLLQPMGDFAGAPLHFEQSLMIRRLVLGDDHPDTAQSVNNMAALLWAVGDLAAARPYYEHALEIKRRVLGNDHPNTARSLNNLGVLLDDMGDLAAARSYLEQALEIRRRVLGNDHPDIAQSLNNLGALFRAEGDLAAARQHYEQALEIYRRVLGNDHPDTARSLNNLGGLEVASGRIDEAVALMHQAAAIDDRMIGQIFSIGSDQQRLLLLQHLQGNYEAFLSLLYRQLSRSPEAVRTALDLVLRRKAIGAEALAAQRDAILGGRYPHLREAFDKLTRLRHRIAQKMLAGPPHGETVTAHERALHEWWQEQQQHEAALARQIPEMNLEQQFPKADRRTIALALPEGVVLVEFVRFDVFDFYAVPVRCERRWQPARYLAFVLRAGQPEQVQMIDLGEADPTDQMIADFRAVASKDPEKGNGRDVTVVATEPRAASPSEGTQLRAAVFDPLRAALGNRTQLLIAPDGDLARLPFEVLPTDDGRRLIDQYQISYVSCGRDVLRFRTKHTRQPAAPIVVADPDFDLHSEGTESSDPLTLAHSPEGRGNAVNTSGRRSLDLERGRVKVEPAERLPATREEGEAIAKLLGDARLWVGDDALEGRLKKECCSPRILHMATHGHFLEDQERDPNKEFRDLGVVGWQAGESMGRLPAAGLENPLLRSWLVLAGFNTWLRKGQPAPEAEDGILTAEDVTGLDLLDTELVVLSACDTGLGEVHVGEGVFGLRRAFALAGAKTLVMSLWKVPDQQTQELMEDFYRRILAGEPRAEALRQAQLSLKARYPHPFYWGAFICQGEPGPMAVEHIAVKG